MTREYAIVFEKTPMGWSAYAPDLPGLGVAGESFAETQDRIREGIAFHIEGPRADGIAIPEVEARVLTMAVSA